MVFELFPYGFRGFSKVCRANGSVGAALYSLQHGRAKGTLEAKYLWTGDMRVKLVGSCLQATLANT